MSVRIIVGDALEQLRLLPDDSVDLICTSPPYWRQRDYRVAGQIGLEERPEDYIAALTQVFGEARRVLRSAGSCWINIGDKWAASGNGGGGSFMQERRCWDHAATARGFRAAPAGYKRKDLIGLPFMLAFAMRAEGWYWRSTEIWAKPNGMPESVADRPTVAHEYVLQFSKSEDYYFDAGAVRLPAVPESIARLERAMRAQLGEGSFVISGGGYAPPGQQPHSGARRGTLTGSPHGRHALGQNLPPDEQRADKTNRKARGHFDKQQGKPQADGGADLRSVWWLPVANSTEAHFAIMPEELAAICILSSSPLRGLVLDPFLGSGTTAAGAEALGRDCIGIELNPEFVAIAKRRAREPGFVLDQNEVIPPSPSFNRAEGSNTEGERLL